MIEVLDTDFIKETKVTSSKSILFYEDGRVAFKHTCDRTERHAGVIICAPQLQIENDGHKVLSTDPVTISPSIACSDCGTHGFVKEGNWFPA